jgi:hypothetical protein
VVGAVTRLSSIVKAAAVGAISPRAVHRVIGVVVVGSSGGSLVGSPVGIPVGTRSAHTLVREPRDVVE